MTAIDLVLLAIVAVSALFGAFRGLIGVLASLAAWILAGWAAFRFGGEVALLLAGDAQPGAAHLFGGYALARSEEHTSELQSRENLVCRLLLEKKKKQK